MTDRVYLHPSVLSDPLRVSFIETLTGRRAYWRDGRRAELTFEPNPRWWRADEPATDYVGTPTWEQDPKGAA